MPNWIAYVLASNDTVHRVDIGPAPNSIAAAAQVMHAKPWIAASDIMCVATVDFVRVALEGSEPRREFDLTQAQTFLSLRG